jgi:hypothetical protein
MKKMNPSNIPASVKQRLFNICRERSVDFQIFLRRYAFERLLYRMALSGDNKLFLLKGAMLFYIWGGDDFRTTIDMDLLGRVSNNPEIITDTVRKWCSVDIPENDGIVFDSASIRAIPISEEEIYSGVRVNLRAFLDRIRIDLQIDVGFGDAVNPKWFVFPSLLDAPRPRIRIYPPETVIAEKLETIVKLGIFNSRMKDYYDIWSLSKILDFQLDRLASAITATFARRKTDLPAGWPEGLTESYFRSEGPNKYWNAFINKGIFKFKPESFEQLGVELRNFLELPIRSVKTSEIMKKTWSASTWQENE